MKSKLIKGTALALLLATMIPALLSTSIPMPVGSQYVQTFEGGGTEVWGYISENKTWTLSGSPYIVIGDVTVDTGVFLTIEPKVMVKFTSGKTLAIFGGLIAQGNATHEITFTTNSSTPSPEDWGSVRFKGTYFLIDYVLIEYATKGLELLNVANISNSVISYCNVGVEKKLGYANNLRVTDNTVGGLSLSSSLQIENSNVSSNGGYGIAITATINMDNTIVSNNAEDGVVLSNGGNIKNSRITGNGGNGTCILEPTIIENTNISGNGGDGIWTKSSTSIAECNITENTKNGVRGSNVVGSITIQNSNISYNRGGDGIQTDSSLTVQRCDVTYNEGNGVVAPKNVDISVYLSNICNNTLNGLSGRGYVSNSNVSGNTMYGILGNFTIESHTNITWNHGGGFNGTGKIYWSSIFNNTLYGGYDAVADIWPNNINATSNWWGTNASDIIEEHIWDYNDTAGALGHVFYAPCLPRPPWFEDHYRPEISAPMLRGTSPDPYLKRTGKLDGVALDFPIRINEPVEVSVNVTDNTSPTPSGVDKVLLSYRVINKTVVGEWWNITMTLTKMYNETSGNWVAVIPAQQAPVKSNSTVEFFIQAIDKAGNPAQSDDYSYLVVWLWEGDINGDGYLDIKDVTMIARKFGHYYYPESGKYGP